MLDSRIPTLFIATPFLGAFGSLPSTWSSGELFAPAGLLRMPVAGYYFALAIMAALAVGAAACSNRRFRIALLITILTGTVIVPGLVYLNVLISAVGIVLSLVALALALRELRFPAADSTTGT